MKPANNSRVCGGGLFCVALILGCLSSAQAQTEPDSLQQAAFRFEVDVNLVNIIVTVTDKKGGVVKGLSLQDFKIYEDGKQQQIVQVDVQEDVPVSLAIVLDASGSMVDKIQEARDAVNHFLASINSESEACIYQFNINVQMVQNFTSDRARLESALNIIHAQGGTAMYDAVSDAVVKLQDGQFSKKAVLLITDGNDTSSRKSFDSVREELQSDDVLIYIIGIGHGERGSYGHDAFGATSDKVNKKVLEAFTKDTGGRTFIIKGAHVVKGKDVIDEAALAVAKDLYYQYVLSYVSSNESANRDWRKIKVKVKKKKTRVLARRGYRRREKTDARSNPHFSPKQKKGSF